jgi:peptide/nickel transport system ATP-binding protein
MLLEVRDLRVVFHRRGQPDTVAVDGIGFDVPAGQVVGLVGESGSGRSATAMAVMRRLPRRGVRVSGRVLLDGVDLLTLPGAEMRARRGRDVSMVLQNPFPVLNPVVPIGPQLAGALRRHRGLGRTPARGAAAELLDRVGVPHPRRALGTYPGQLSHSARSRVLIAMAAAGRPRLLVADEPTAGLDVTTQAQILELLRELVRETGTGLLLTTHDFGVVAGTCETVNVLYRGRIVERAQRHRLFGTPRHPYTHGLLGAIPRLDGPPAVGLATIRGSGTDRLSWGEACAFAPRCARALQRCRDLPPSVDVSGGRLLRCHNPVPASPE